MRKVLLLVLSCVGMTARAEKAKFPELVVSEGVGVNIHFTDARPGEMKMIREAGCRIVRMDFGWGGTERKKGEYDFSAYDRLMASLDEHKIRALFILDYSNKNYDGGLSPHSEEGRAAFAAWAAAAVKHFAGRGIIWEMYNEPNIHFWKPRPNVEHYTKLSNAVGKAIRAVAPDELYVGPVTSQIDLKFLEECFQAGCLEYWDAVSVHPYRQKDPETVCEEYRNLRLLIAKYAPKGKRIPILSGEWGYSAAWGKFDEVRQGKYLPRQWLVNLYNEVPVSIWYDWHDDGKDPEEAEHHFGTVKYEYRKGEAQVYEPKDAYRAAQTLTRELAEFAYNKRLWMGKEEDWVLLFTKGEEVKVVAWTTGREHEVVVPASAGKFEVVEYRGEIIGPLHVAGKEGLKLMLKDTVQYLTPVEKNDLLRVGAAWERAPLEYVADEPSAVIPVVKNVLQRAVDAKSGLEGGDSKVVTLQPGQSSQPRVGTSEGVRRLDNRAALVTTLEVDNARLAQATMWMSARPLVITLYPAVGKSIAIGVDNPTGKARRIRIVLGQGAGLAPASPGDELKFGPDVAREQFLRIPLFVEPIYQRQIIAFAASDEEGALGEIRQEHFSVLHNIFTAEQVRQSLKLVTDGDAKVGSKLTMDVVEKPQKLPTGQTPDAIRINYEFEAGWKFIRLVPVKEELKKIEGKPRQLGFWVYGDESGNVARCRFIDAEGEVFQPSGFLLNFKGWKWMTIPMDGSETAHWGKGDGTVQYPIRWDSLLLIDSAHRRKTEGEIWVAGMTLIE